MPEDSPQGPGDGEQPGPPGPWLPPGPPGGYGPPPPGPRGYGPPAPAPGSYGQPGPRECGQPDRYGQSPPGGYGQPGGSGAPSWPGAWQPPPEAPRPGIIPLRPLGVGEILDGGFTAIRRNPKVTLGPAALFLTVSGVVTTGVAVCVSRIIHGPPVPSVGSTVTPAELARILSQDVRFAVPVALASGVFAFIVQLLLTGVLTPVAGQAVLGRQISPHDAWRLAAARLPSLLGATLLTGLVLLLALMPFTALVVIMLVASPPVRVVALCVPLALVTTLCLLVWLWTMLSLAVPSVVLESQGPASALSRSWQLVRQSFWRVLGIQLLTGLIVAVAAVVLEIPFQIVSAVFRSGGTLGVLGSGATVPSLIVAGIGSVAAGVLTRPLAAAVTVLLYVDLRMRKEGLDLLLRAAGTGEEFASVWRPSFPPAARAGAVPAAAAGPAGPAAAAGPADPPGPAPPVAPPPVW